MTSSTWLGRVCAGLGLLVLVAVGSTSCSTSSSSVGPVVPATSGTGTSTPSDDLATRTHDRLASVLSVHTISRTTYPDDVACRGWGAPLSEALVSTDHTHGWVDVGQDGSIDAMRDGDALVVSTRLVPDWGVTTDWISIPASPTDRATIQALLSSPLKSALSPLIATGTPLADTVSGTEELMRAHGETVDGHETVNGHQTTRYLITPTEAHDLSARVWVDDDNIIRRFEIDDTQEHNSSSSQSADVIGLDESVMVALPPSDHITPIGRVAAGPVLLSHTDSDPSCMPDDRRASTEARRACIKAAAGNDDIDGYLRKQPANDPLHPYGCQAP